MSIRTMKYLISFLLFFITINLFSQSKTMTFQDCLNLAIENNLTLKTAEVNEEIAKTMYKTSYGKLLPTLTGDVENRNSWGREINPKTNLFENNDLKNHVGSLESDLFLFNGFLVQNTIKSAKQELKINDFNIEKVKNEITLELAQNFLTILYLNEIIIANQEQINFSTKQLEIANLKFTGGAISESEVFKIQSQKASEELKLFANQNLLRENFFKIKQMMNMPFDKEINLIKPDVDLMEKISLEEEPFDLTAKAIENQPIYEMSLLREKKARTSLSIARSGLYPSLRVRGLYRSIYDAKDDINAFDDQVNGNFSKGIRLYLVIPIFSQFDNYAKIKTSKLNIKQSKINTQIVKNQLSQSVLKAISDTKASVLKNESSKIAFEYAQKSYEADLLKFEYGKININELNLTKTILNSAQVQLIQSKYELLFNNALIKFYKGEAYSL